MFTPAPLRRQRSTQAPRRACGLALLVATWLGGTIVAYAQEESGAGYWLQERQRTERAQ